MIMKILALCILFFLEINGGLIPDPIDVFSSAAGAVGEGVDAAAGGIIDGSKAAVETAGKINNKIVNKTDTIVGKVHEGVFDIENGFINGVDEVIGTPVDLTEVTFHLATSENYKNPKQIDFYEPVELVTKTGKIYFLIHGWTSSRNASWFKDLSVILTEGKPENRVVQLDWSNPAGDNYAFAAFQTETVGNFVGILVNKLVAEFKVPRENIVLIGHSLGGQIAGWAGKKFKEMSGKRLPRIIALDPAGPLFILRPDSRRLNKDDADVVMVIHSDGGKLGFPFQCGTIDFFPNGGSNQPGCWKVDLAKVSTYVEPVTCDHSRGWDFFVEAVNSTGSFLAKKCESYDNFLENVCEAVVVAMGDLETTAKGTFYLQTKNERPYNKAFKGIMETVKKTAEKIGNEMSETKNDKVIPKGKTGNLEKNTPRDLKI